MSRNVGEALDELERLGFIVQTLIDLTRCDPPPAMAGMYEVLAGVRDRVGRINVLLHTNNGAAAVEKIDTTDMDLRQVAANAIRERDRLQGGMDEAYQEMYRTLELIEKAEALGELKLNINDRAAVLNALGTARAVHLPY